MAGTRAGESAIRPRSVSFIGEPWSALDLSPTVPGQPTNPRTRVVARFRRGIPFRLELAPSPARPLPSRPRERAWSRRATRSLIGGFVVQANDAEMARDFLEPQVRRAIGSLERLVHAGGMLVSINPERLLVQIDRNLGQSTEALIQAVERGPDDPRWSPVRRQSTHERGNRDRRPGRNAADEDAGPPTCKVCGEPIDGGAVVLCSSCNTPHHRDCWEYVGACSIYGCGCRMARQTDRSRTLIHVHATDSASRLGLIN